jgi:hypothetical protein
MSMKVAILVDWELFSDSEKVQKLVRQRSGQARLILLVNDPKKRDYDFDDFQDFAWDAVIRNNGNLDVVKFKERALDILQNASSAVPVMALDPWGDVNDMYRRNGVLVTLKDLK